MQELTEWTWNSARAAGVLPKEWLNLHGSDLTWANLHGADLHGGEPRFFRVAALVWLAKCQLWCAAGATTGISPV